MLEDIRYLKFIVEIRFPFVFSLNNDMWNIAESYKEYAQTVGTSPGGVMLENTAGKYHFIIEIGRAGYSKEDIEKKDLVQTQNEAANFIKNVLTEIDDKTKTLARVGVRYLVGLKDSAKMTDPLCYYADLLWKGLNPKLTRETYGPRSSVLSFVDESDSNGLKCMVMNGDLNEIQERTGIFRYPVHFQPESAHGIFLDCDIFNKNVKLETEVNKPGFRPKIEKFSIEKSISDAKDISERYIKNIIQLVKGAQPDGPRT